MKHITKTDTDHLSECLSQIEQHLNWGPAIHWNNQDFISLGDKIYEKTGVKLSHTTLKRVWGKIKYESFPQTATLNALAKFLGYENWLNFKVENGGSSKDQHTQKADQSNGIPNNNSAEEGYSNKNRTWQYVFIFSLIAFFVISILNYPRDPGLTEKVLKSIEFSSEKVAEGIPNTVVFNYDVSKARATQFEIQQSWDERKRFDISPYEKVATSIYYLPGYFRAKLLIDKKIVKEHDLFIKSGGWLTAIESGRTPRYLNDEEIIRQSRLALSESVINEIESDRDDPSWLGFHYVEDMGEVDCDNFTFEASIKNTYTKGDGICRESRIYILGTEGAFGISLAIPGCAGDLRLMFRDVVQDGKNHDLSAFGTEYGDFQKLKLVVRNKEAAIYLDDHLIHQLSYKATAGKLAGFRLKFKGSGEVDYVKVRDEKGNMVYEENFEK